MAKFPRATSATALAAQSATPAVELEADAMSIETFCARHGISRATFYLMRADGRAPTMMKVGTRILVSREAAEAWRRKMEAGAK